MAVAKTGDPQPMTAAGLLGIIVAAALLALLGRGFSEPFWLDVAHVQISRRSPAGKKVPDAAHPAAGGLPRSAPLRILLLADLHAEILRVPRAKILAGCAMARPDLILFAGDLAGKPASLPAAFDLLRAIRALPNLEGCPFIAVRGNHDTDNAVIEPAWSELGVQCLQNEAAVLNLQGEDWLVAGLDDLKTGQPDATAALAEADRQKIPPERRIVLAHNPDALLGLDASRAGLFLAGHLHGGQIWLPFRLEFHLLRGEKLPRSGHIRGFFHWHGLPAYISRGLGCVLLPLRLFSRPEITIIEML